MKKFLYFIVGVAVVLGFISAFWWLQTGETIEEQIEYVKETLSDGVEDTSVSNVADSASKLGKVLKNNFDDAQNVYQNGIEAKYE